MGGMNQLREILREDQEVLDPHELQKTVPGLWEGLVGWFVIPLENTLIHVSHSGAIAGNLMHSFTHSIHCSSSLVESALRISLHSLIFPHFSVLD
jgi:hypothetical protein